MTEHHEVIGDAEAGRSRGIVLQVDGARMLVQYYNGVKRWERAPRKLRQGEPSRPGPSAAPGFEDVSEQQFARLLDFYEIEWEYEPHTFDLPAGGDTASEAFSPDFYLPAFDLYIEVTTGAPDSVREKTRRVKRLKELYPTLICKVLYQRDYLNLLAKYGLEDVVSPSTQASAEDVRDSEGAAAARADLQALIA